MIYAITLILIALVWLMIETKWLSIRLPYGAKLPSGIKLLTAGKPILLLPEPKTIDTSIPYYWMTSEQKEKSMEICMNNYNCPHKNKCKKSERWTYWKLPKRTVKAFGSTFNLESGCNIHRALLLREIANEYNRKSAQTVKAPCQLNITLMGFDSFGEKDDTVKYVGFVPIEWIDQHKNDEYPEPTMELIVNDKTFHVNGNYEKGLIPSLMESKIRKQNKKPSYI